MSQSLTPEAKRELLDRVFGDPSVRYGLSVFDPWEIEKLKLSVKGHRAYVNCVVTGRPRPAKPEEIIRQLFVLRLADQQHYPLDRFAVEVPVKLGSTVASKKADIVVYTDKAKQTPFIIVETKKQRRKDGLDQLHSYMNATGVHYGVWTNGSDLVAQLRVGPNLFEELPRLPAVDETLDDVKAPIRKDQLQPIHDLKGEVEYLEDAVLATAGVSAFEEIFKLIFAKLYDEFSKADDEAIEFRVTTAPPKEQYRRLNGLFHRACAEWPGIFPATDRIELSAEALVAVASAFQTKRFSDSDLDVIDAAFEHMINPEQKSDKGQYFTPRPVVKMCVKMMNPKPDERVIDPACGPAGFLIHALQRVFELHIRPRFKNSYAKRKADYATKRLFGIDFDPRLARVAKAMMLIAGDGRTNIFRASSLDPREWEDRDDGLASAIQNGAFDVLLTNPPFAGSISAPEVLGGYDLAYKGDPGQHKRANKMTRDVLFIERCLRFLKPGGRMAIVLPQGNLNNVKAEPLRAWVMEKARILAVVGLHVNTFKPFTGTKTSVLFLQKWGQGEKPLRDYPIFMAVNEKPVKDNSGNYIFRPADTVADRQIDHDFDEIADGFIGFAREHGFDFWRE